MERAHPQLGTQTETTGGRILAWFADVIIVFVIAVIVGRVSGSLRNFFLVLVVGSFAYRTYFEASYGQTFGKKWVNVVVVMENGDPCDWTAATIRNVVRVIDALLFYLVGLAVIVVTDDNQRLGDLVGGTIVTRAAQAGGAVSVETGEATEVDRTSATLNGEVTELDGADEANVGFEYGESGGDLGAFVDVGTVSSTVSFDGIAGDLESDTDYEFRAVAETDEDSDRGDVVTFTTDAVGDETAFQIKLHQDNTTGDRFVELLNRSEKQVNLSRGTLRTESGSVFRFPQDESVHRPDHRKAFPIPEDFDIDTDSEVILVTADGDQYDVDWDIP